MTTSPGTIESGGRGSAGDEPVPHGEDVSGTDDTVSSGAGYEPMSIRGPAFIVLGLAVVILIGGVVASAISSGSDPTFVLRKVTGFLVRNSPGVADRQLPDAAQESF